MTFAYRVNTLSTSVMCLINTTNVSEAEFVGSVVEKQTQISVYLYLGVKYLDPASQCTKHTCQITKEHRYKVGEKKK